MNCSISNTDQATAELASAAPDVLVPEKALEALEHVADLDLADSEEFALARLLLERQLAVHAVAIEDLLVNPVDASSLAAWVADASKIQIALDLLNEISYVDETQEEDADAAAQEAMMTRHD